MKKALIIISLLFIMAQVFGLQITLTSGKSYTGLLKSADNGFISILDEKVEIIVPIGTIKQILDGKDDVTAKLIKQATPPEIDAHFIMSDDYFYAPEPLGESAWKWAFIGKLRVPATPETKNQAKFFNIQNGTEDWYSWWAKTKKAEKADLVVGTLVIAYNDNQQNDVYEAPNDQTEARQGSWFMAKITDTSDFFKGFIMVSGGYKVSVNNLRVTIRG